MEAKESAGCTPLHAAVQGGHQDIARLLIDRGADTWSTEDEGLTPLQLAVKAEQEDMVGLFHSDS